VRRITILLAALAALMLVPAAQAFATPSFKLNIVGTGSGEVTSVEEYPFELGEPPIACSYNGTSTSGVCENEPEETAPNTYGVELLAAAPAGSEFAGWTVQKGSSLDAECPYPGEAEYCLLYGESGQEELEATAEFKLAGPPPPAGPPLTLKIEEGSGTVVSNPAGIECTGAAETSCTTEEIEEGTVTLTASPAPGYLFKSWKKCDTGGVNGRQCTINLNEAKTVGAKFVKVWSLEGAKAGGQGILSTSPGGVNCGYACSSSSALYKEVPVTVKSKPAKHFHFVEFTGGTGSAAVCNGETTPTCVFTIGEGSSIEELYAEDAKNTLSLAKEGGGQGFVKTKPTNVNCGLTCTSAEAEFFASEEPEVLVTLGKGTSSVTWTTGAGTCTGNALTCKVPMSSSHSLVAKFE
jgi:hypothetical protein